MQYQSFPGVKGGSESSKKLTALRLPSLEGKRFLDVGCNEGFFCGYALFDGAERVVGMDKSASAIKKASHRFPQGEFVHQSWESLPDGNFHVITLLSALHYAEDQADLIHRLMERLADDGVLVLEISMAEGAADEWIRVKRSIDERYFPTRKKLGVILNNYAWKVIGHSVNQAGDPLQRYVVHVRKLKPYAWLLMQTPGSGKSTIARRLFAAARVPVISGDRTYLQITQGKFEISDTLRALVSESFTTASIDKVTDRVLKKGLAGELVELWSRQAGFRDFALDSYVPEAHRQSVKDALAGLGYFPVEAFWNVGAPITQTAEAANRASHYEAHLRETMNNSPSDCVRVKRLLKDELKPLVRWHLDSPTNGEWLVDAENFKVAGWIIGTGRFETDFQVYVMNQAECLMFKRDRFREDVLGSLYGGEKDAPEFWRSTPCGFSFELPIAWLESGFEIGVAVSDERIALARLTNEAERPESPGMGTRLLRYFRHNQR